MSGPTPNLKCKRIVAPRTARTANYANAQRFPRGRVCTHHGGKAKQVVHAARVRLQNSADKMARELLGMATNPNVSDSVKIIAIRDALDRAGLKPATTVDLG